MTEKPLGLKPLDYHADIINIVEPIIDLDNPTKQEEELKRLNGIPSYERIAVILYAGYYDEKSIFAVSPRKDFEEYYTEHI